MLGGRCPLRAADEQAQAAFRAAQQVRVRVATAPSAPISTVSVPDQVPAVNCLETTYPSLSRVITSQAFVPSVESVGVA